MKPANWRRSAVATIALSLGLSTLGNPGAQAAEDVVTGVNSTITVTTSGWGHGVGMSQYGAYGAATKGLKFSEILNFYYPGTSQARLDAGSTIDVWLTKDTDKKLHFYPASGLTIKDSAGKKKVLPSGKNYKLWRISRSGSKRVLYYKNAKGKYIKYSSGLSSTKKWYVYNTKTDKVKTWISSSNKPTYRGQLILEFFGKGALVTNRVTFEDYLRSVVPSEMPASWHAEALKSQAVAARSYAARYKKNIGDSKPYDICDTTSCQVYYGTSKEHANTDAAIKATANIILTYKDTIAYTMFSSSNGGWSKKGDYAYLTAHEDPYDSLKLNQFRYVTLTASQIQKKYPTIGTFKSITVKRDGKGLWGGRLTEVTIKGSKASKTVTGSSFKSTFGLKETLANITGGLAAKTANLERWVKEKNVNGVVGVPTGSEKVIGTGLHAPFSGGGLYWTKATSSRFLYGAIEEAYQADGGPAKSDLGWPTSDIKKVATTKVASISSGVQATFEKGLITCPPDNNQAADCVVSYG